MTELADQIRACRICAERFAATATRHQPRPVPWFRPAARILIAGQAPGLQVHQKGRPFDDRSGDRLRDWMGVDRATFYDRDRVAVVPMAFCFPGYDAKGSDLPPPPVCAATWRDRVMATLPDVRLKLIVGAYAMRWHLGVSGRMTDIVRDFPQYPANLIPLPHPSWRNTGWLQKNPWFETDLLPVLRRRVKEALSD
ncbi:uracil-DNA glycosylase family protein [Pseudooceanicola sp.]|uniref:uracil-DNA glycosylase family protein n=1 Tax=Pseudooceanicola sp. TaxID=1914328 RepID=UPI00405801D0